MAKTASKINEQIDTEKLCKIDANIPKIEWEIRAFSDTMLNMQTLLKHVFYHRNTMFFEGTAVRKMNETCKTHAQNLCLKNIRKIHDIWSKNEAKNGHLKHPKPYLFRYILACDFRHVFEVIFGSKTGPTWIQKGIQNVMENHQKSSPAPGCHFGAIWGRFLTDVGSILD